MEPLHAFMELIRAELGDAFVVDKERNVIWSRVGFGNFEPNIGIKFKYGAGYVMVNGVYPDGMRSGKEITVSLKRNPKSAAKDTMKRVWGPYRTAVEKHVDYCNTTDAENAYRLMQYGYEIDLTGDHPVARGGKYQWVITVAGGMAHIIGSIPIDDLIEML